MILGISPHQTVNHINRGLRPVIDAIDMDGCPVCGEHPVGVDLRGPQDIRLTCGHVIDARAWADDQYEKDMNEE